MYPISSTSQEEHLKIFDCLHWLANIWQLIIILQIVVFFTAHITVLRRIHIFRNWCSGLEIDVLDHFSVSFHFYFIFSTDFEEKSNFFRNIFIQTSIFQPYEISE